MTRYIQFIFFQLLIVFQLHAQHTYRIEGTIDNTIDTAKNTDGPLRNGGYVFLELIGGRVIDSARIEHNRFSFEGASEFVEIANISYRYGGVTIYIADSSSYVCRFILSSPEEGLYQYESTLTTDSEFYNYALSIDGRQADLLKRRRALTDLLNQGQDFQSELEVIDEVIIALYDEVMSDAEMNIEEKLYILMGDPNFSVAKYHSYFDNLPESVRNTPMGKLFYKKLERFKNL